VLITSEQKPWQSLIEWMEAEGLAADLTDARYGDPEYRLANFAHIQEIVEVFFLLQRADDIYHEGQRRGLPVGVLNAPEDLPHDEHLFSALAAPPLTRAPRLGEHTADVVGEQS
jgi:benzylsuccinate CoA-transferase BbsE subunit